MLIKYCVLTTAHFHETRCRFVEKTWGNGKDALFLTDAAGPDDRYIVVSDTHERVVFWQKIMNGLIYLCETYRQHDWFYLCDDDTYCFTHAIATFLKDKDCSKNVVYGEIRNSFAEDDTLYYPVGGGGRIISAEALRNMYHLLKKGMFKTFQWGDVTLGYILKDSNIKMINDDRFHSQTPAHYGFEINAELLNQFSFHFIRDENQFLELYAVEQSEKKI